ncbi:hypothetical protein A3J15_03765 [Candidatus Roizmanbacteria bacterium RIFCSPLOWO2_02_FULL_38_10]|uniref:Type II secretion system protein GspF domain-containing protein n=1 Tax=Candidatus Roizmanbacteria bacterium RIFCSPLOWO2_02_FULL_38_10 TaxID=1802074 RepID=A0A1F7JJI5_9BACT|nr:MAG: hypothetical protein A3J15_03765 [Candidatus Roizmanbacteria bacterium RIFCSPLOWO2_02_FULL_38_10]
MKAENISLSTTDKIGFVSNFSTMLGSGISILEAVDSLLEDAKGNQKKMLEMLRDDLIQGKRVYLSFSKFPKVFDKVTINLVKAAEESGTLDVALKDLKNSILKESEFTDKIKSALAYPILICIVFIGVMLVILIFVIPKIAQVFSQLRVTLPLPTKILIFISGVMTKNTIPMLIGLTAFIIGMFYLFKSRRRQFYSLFFHLPLVSILIKQIDLTRFSRNLYYLLNSGIPITNALELTEDVVLRGDIARIIHNCRETVSSGKRLSEGLRSDKKTIPSIMIKIVEAGEKSGTLDKSLLDISDFLDYQVTNSLRTITALIEPIMLVFVGVLIGGMMLSIIAPIYGLISQIGQR